MLMVFRILGLISIVIRFGLGGSVSIVTRSLVFWLYIILTFIFTMLFNYQSKKADRLVFHFFLTLIDTLVINYFIFQTGNANTDIYLLLFVPLVTAAHFLSRIVAVIVSIGIAAIYSITFFFLSTAPNSAASIILLILHCTLLLGGAWLYRVQRNLPNAKETWIISPFKARKNLESLLKELALTVPYDTVSVQILYRGRLQIVACLGFEEHQEEIYQIEFPLDDKKFPNHLVMQSKKPIYVNADQYPSFKQDQYFASHIKTWMGVPLISPSTSECFGMISIDSKKPNAYNKRDLNRANWFAKAASQFLIEAALGPAALTQATKRINFQRALTILTELIPKDNQIARLFPDRSTIWENDLQAAKDLVSLGQKIFQVEDCSIFFLRHRYIDGVYEKVLHLVASSTIPSEVFEKHEIIVTGEPGDGLTGMVVSRNRSINYGAEQIRQSPFRGSFTGHLQYLFSRCSKQIMICPLRNYNEKEKGGASPTGAIKIENRLGWTSENPFPVIDRQLFELYSMLISLILENIYQRNYVNRQQQSIHNIRSIIHHTAAKPLMDILQGNQGDTVEVNTKRLRDVLNSVNYTKSTLDGILSESAETLILEKEGLFAAIYQYVETLKKMPNLQPVCERIIISFPELRDNLPARVRASFHNIAKEAILNLVRHSKIDEQEGGRAEIRSTLEDNIVHLFIEDNGIGFLPQHVQQHSLHFGLRDMKFQIAAIRQVGLQANFEIKSHPEQGTRIHAWASLNS